MRLAGFEFVEQRARRFKFPEVSPQQRIHKSRLCSKAPLFGQFHGHVNRGMARDTVQPENLVQAETEQVLESGFLSPMAGLAIDQPVQSCLPSDDPIHELLTQPAVSRREVRSL